MQDITLECTGKESLLVAFVVVVIDVRRGKRCAYLRGNKSGGVAWGLRPFAGEGQQRVI